MLLDKNVGHLSEAVRIFLDIETQSEQCDVVSGHRDTVGMVQRGVGYTLGYCPVKEKHQQGLATAWPEEKPGLGICREAIVSFCY